MVVGAVVVVAVAVGEVGTRTMTAAAMIGTRDTTSTTIGIGG